MKIIKENLRPLSLMLLIPLMSLSYLLINKFSGDAHDITVHWDSHIPFIKYFVIPYIVWYLFVPIAFFLLCLKDKKMYYKALLVYTIGCMTASVIFLLYQTTVPRTPIHGDDFLTWIMLQIYANDKPVNCLPSIHVFTCWLILRAIPASQLGGMRNNIMTGSISILIILSTLFTKQHAILDVITGILLAEGLLLLVRQFEIQLASLSERKPFKYFRVNQDLKPD